MIIEIHEWNYVQKCSSANICSAFIKSRDAFLRRMKPRAASHPRSANPKCLECHCCERSDVWMHLNHSRPHALLHTNLLLSQACCKLPKYLPCSCQRLSAQQLEWLWCISSTSFRPSAEHPFSLKGREHQSLRGLKRSVSAETVNCTFSSLLCDSDDVKSCHSPTAV